MWGWPGHRSLPQSHWSSHRRIFLPTGAGLVWIIVEMKIVIVMTSVMDSKWLNTKLCSHGNCECSKSNLGWEPRIRILFVELVVELSKVGHHGKFVRATIFFMIFGFKKKIGAFPKLICCCLPGHLDQVFHIKKSWDPKFFLSNTKSKGTVSVKRVMFEILKNGCFGYEM